MTHSARLTNSFAGEWELYVVTDGPSLEWPEHSFERTAPVPTLQERADALALLGYAVVDGASWEWQETPTGVMDRVELLASIPVRPVGAATAALRCPAAHPEDPTPCGGPVVVTILDAANAGADGCEHHAGRLLASLVSGRPIPKPDAPAGLDMRIFRAAHHTRPFPWREERS